MQSLNNALGKLGINNFVIVDVGAKGQIETINGIESISEIHAFEPNPIEFALLENKYKKHAFKKLHINCVGLSEAIGKASFMLANNAAMSSLLKPDLKNYKKHFGNYKAYKYWENCIETAEEIEINLDTLDHYFTPNKPIDYIKIDTQGAELAILKGAEKILQQGLIKVLKVEVATVATYEHQPLFSDIDIYLRQYNYILVDFLTYRENPSYLLGEDQEIHFAPSGDAIYYYAPNSVSAIENIKKGIIINQLGYVSLALHILESTSLSKIEISDLILKSKNKSHKKWKKIAKDILPPLLIKLLKKSKF